jgi:hypothetical protein
MPTSAKTYRMATLFGTVQYCIFNDLPIKLWFGILSILKTNLFSTGTVTKECFVIQLLSNASKQIYQLYAAIPLFPWKKIAYN